MSKFKVGDKVRILDGSKIENYTGLWSEAMKEYIGEVHTIESVDRDWTNGRVSYVFNDLFFMWDERGLELVSEKKIVITTDGRITKARLYNGKEAVREAFASCAPDDKFDFDVGARLAFTRLMGTSPTAASLDWDKFAHGMLEVKVTKKNYGAFIKECYQRGFTWYRCAQVNPWKIYDEMRPSVKTFLLFIRDAPSEHIYISVADGDLKWDNKRHENLDEYEFV